MKHEHEHDMNMNMKQEHEHEHAHAYHGPTGQLLRCLRCLPQLCAQGAGRRVTRCGHGTVLGAGRHVYLPPYVLPRSTSFLH